MSSRRKPVIELTDDDRRLGLDNLRKLGFSTIPVDYLELDPVEDAITIDRPEGDR